MTFEGIEGSGKSFQSRKLYNNLKKRKISAILSLNNATDYEGGEVEMHTGHPDEKPFTIEELKTQATLIFFPSFIWHRVKPLTKGVRYSLVSWARGEPFR